MMKKKSIVSALLVIFSIIFAACGFTPAIGDPNNPISSDNVTNTAAAKTVSAIGTEIADGRNPTLIGPKPPTPTPTPTLTPTPTPTQTLTPTIFVCTNQATFVNDVTIQDGSTILPKSWFIKTWELKNTGSCTWRSSYRVVFAGRGVAMDGKAETALPREVGPNESVQVSVRLRAPGELGNYAGYWWLRSGDGKLFGTDRNAAAPFFVKIQVADHYSFVEHTCEAKWSSTSGDLPCPGQDSNSGGFIQPVNNPGMEDNQPHSGPGWVMMPQPIIGGWVMGKFSPVVVPDHSDLRGLISCHPDAKGCYVRFKITYQVDNGPEQVLGEWNEGYDNNLNSITEDLDMVAGKSTAFTFYVYVSGPPDQSKAVWFDPRIIKN